jgi:hypothetical protein
MQITVKRKKGTEPACGFHDFYYLSQLAAALLYLRDRYKGPALVIDHLSESSKPEIWPLTELLALEPLALEAYLTELAHAGNWNMTQLKGSLGC